MYIYLNNRFNEKFDIPRKLINFNRNNINHYLKNEDQNKRVFIKIRYSIFGVFDIFQGFDVFSSFYKKSNIF